MESPFVVCSSVDGVVLDNSVTMEGSEEVSVVITNGTVGVKVVSSGLYFPDPPSPG